MRHFLVFVALLLLVLPVRAAQKTGIEIQKKRQNAVDLFEQGKYEDANRLLEEVLAEDPEDATASRYILIYRRQVAEPYCKQAADAYLIGNYPEAVRIWEEVIKLNPSERRVKRLIEETIEVSNQKAAKSLYADAESAIKEGRYEDALHEIEKVLEIKPDDKLAAEMLQTVGQTITDNIMREHYKKADALLKGGDYDSAISEWEQILKIDKAQDLASRFITSTRRLKLDEMYGKASKSYKAGDYVDSRNLYQAILTDNPTDTGAKRTIEKLNKVISVVPHMAEEGKVWDMLRKSLSQYIADDGNPKVSVVSVWYAAQLQSDSMRVQAVRDFVEGELQSDIKGLDVPVPGMNIIDQYLFSSLNHIYEGRYDLAIQKSSLVIELEPENVLALKRLGSAYFAIGRKEKAIETWQRALKISPNDKEIKEYVSQVR